MPPQLIVQAIQKDFAQFNGCDQQDDITLLAVRREIIQDSHTTTIISSLSNLQEEIRALNQFLAVYYGSPGQLTEDVREILAELVGDNSKREFIIRAIVVEEYIKLEIKSLEAKFHWEEEIKCSQFTVDCTNSTQHFDYLCYNNTGRKAILIKYRYPTLE